MKKVLKRLIASFLALNLILVNNTYLLDVRADENSSEYVFVEGLDPKTGREKVITQYLGSSKIIDIPESINGIEVKAIGEGVFRGKALTEVTIPEGITYIGKEAFKDNRITEIDIPDSVEEIAEGAFANMNTDYLSSTKVRGLKGVSTLSDSSFSGIKELSMEIPALRSVNQNAFVPRHRFGQYALLYTKDNENIYELNSLRGSYLIDPVKLRIENVDESEDEEVVLESLVYANINKTNSYNATSDVSIFYKIGQELENFNAQSRILGYAMPLAGKNISIDAIDMDIKFSYKPIWVDIPYVLEASSSRNINGKVSFAGANVKLYREEKVGYYSNWREVKNVVATGNDFVFEDVEIIGGKKYKLVAEVNNEDYRGRSIEYFLKGGSADLSIIKNKKVLESISVKEKEAINLPARVDFEFVDGNTETAYLTWDDGSIITKNEAGTYWFKGVAELDITDTRIPIYIKVDVLVDDEVQNTNKTELYKKIEEAREILQDVIISVDGSDVYEDQRWVAQEDVNLLNQKIEKAREISKNNKVNQNKIEKAISDLDLAISNFISSKRPGTQTRDTRIFGSAIFHLTGADINSENFRDFSLKLLKLGASDSEAIDASSSIYTEAGIRFSFERLEGGIYDLVIPRSYIATVGGNRAGFDVTRINISYNEERFERFVNIDKGRRVSYDFGEHGTSEHVGETYYIHGEHWDALPLPVVVPNAGYEFVGWSDNNGVDIKIEHRAIISDENLLAIYRRSDDDGVNASTKIDGVWALGDFIYEKDKALGKEEEWVIKGFSSSGLTKSTKYFNLTLPHITDEGEPVKAIGLDAFSSKEIDSVEIPDGIERIYATAFYETNITRLVLPNSIEEVGANAFLRAKIEEIVFSNTLVKIGSGAFAENRLRTLAIPESVLRIDSSAFADNQIENVELKEGLEVIGKRAFYQNALRKVKIPLTLRELDIEAFERNPGLNALGSKVALYTEDGTNPHNLIDSDHHVINPNLVEEGISDEKRELMDLLMRVQKLYNLLNVASDSTQVPQDEYFVSDTLKEEMKQALYEGYYSYYDDAKEVLGKKIKYPISIAKESLEEIEEKANNEKELGTGASRIKNEVMLMMGVPGIEFNTDINEEHEFTFNSTSDKNMKAFRFTRVENSAPHTAWLVWEVPDGKYKFEVPVGKVLVYQDGLAGATKPERKPYVEVRNGQLVESEDTENVGFSIEDGVVFIYDLMDGGLSEDKLYETQVRFNGARYVPKVKANKGTHFKGFSLDGENVIDITSLKAEGNLIFKAVYGDGEDETTNKDDEEVENPNNGSNENGNTDSPNNGSDENPNNGNQDTDANSSSTMKFDKNTLFEYIKESEKLISSTVISESENKVNNNSKWIEKEHRDKLYKNIVEANFVYEDSLASADEIESAVRKISEAYKEFKANIKVKKENTSSSSSSSSGKFYGGGSSLSKNKVSSAKKPDNNKGVSFDNIKNYELSKDGKWLYANSNWYFIDANSKVINNSFIRVKTHDANSRALIYYFNKDGIMSTGWIKDDKGFWYYLNKKEEGVEGSLRYKWYYDKSSNKWYYLDENTGKMATSWKEIDGKWYYFATKEDKSKPEGSLYVNEMTPDFYFVNEKGEWIK